jgi:hypothetical protein
MYIKTKTKEEEMTLNGTHLLITVYAYGFNLLTTNILRGTYWKLERPG